MGLAYIWEISKNWRKMKNVRILLKLGGDLLWFIKQHCTKQEVSISKTLALRAFSIFLILWIFLSLSHKSGPHYEKNETCPDFAQTWWGPSLVHTTTLYQAGGLYLQNPGSESILHFSPFLHFSISQISISQISKKLRKMKNIRILLKLGGDLL